MRINRNLAALLGAPALAAGAQAGVVNIHFDSPTHDRWNYPFNFTPGVRGNASTFNAINETDFDDRDGQMFIGFDTGAQLDAGLGEPYYVIVSAVMRIATTDGGFIFDDTYDSITTYSDPMNPEALNGRPCEIFGVGYRGGFNINSYVETSPFGTPNGTNYTAVRNAYITDYPGGVAEDVSNHIFGENIGGTVYPAREVTPFSVGVAEGVTPGAIVPFDTDFVFTLDLGNPDVDLYLRQACNAGKLRLMLSSTHAAVMQGGEFVNWYTKENFFGDGFAARLDMTVMTIDPLVGDLNLDGVVDTADLGLLLGAFGTPGPVGDINGDMVVDTADLGLLLGNFGASVS
ncbi:MAG: hypothetical protein H6813_00295 [Phycisphaeraceae bacterium]|nr:hypothetical protein [Phycisphaeraceae bacterium]MCB9847476.1 hypothetical protein [Phycisphaeraceae bacterium]